MQNPPPPFSCQYSPQVPELLWNLGCSLLVSTYQAGKVIFLSPKNDQALIQLPRTFNKAMGVAFDGKRLAVATKDEVIVLKNAKDLGKYYPTKPNTYDSFFMPRATYHTGELDIHDLEWINGDLIGVNTSFSCLVKIDDQFNFTPFWKPFFIDSVVSEDRCHLNGLAVENESAAYVTAFGKGNSRQSWRETILTSGLVMNVAKNEIVIEGLAMPHSPRIFNGELYVLLSGTGELIKINTELGSYETVYKFDAFVRGMAKYGDYLFVGTSRLRENSSTFAKLNIPGKKSSAGISILHLPTASFVGRIQYLSSVDEIYDVQVLPNMIRPGILNKERGEHKLGVDIPGQTFWARKKA